MLVVSGLTDCEPFVARLPDHEPPAVQLVAFVLFHERVEAPPVFTASGFALNVTVGTGGAADSVTVADAEALPPVPVHSNV